MSDYYYTIEKPALAEYKDRGSKFLAYAFSVLTADDFKEKLKKIKAEHPKTTHHCFAYRVGRDKNNFRTNDDGEPSGIAGLPILAQIDSRQLTNTAVVVVRYFGGTLLGTSGLINAYRTATSLALQLTPAVRKPVLRFYQLRFDYTVMNDVLLLIKRCNGHVVKKETLLFCSLRVGISNANDTLFKERIKGIRNVEIEPIEE